MPEECEHRCLICGKILHDPLAIYCPECEYELKRVCLADEENVEEWLERKRAEREERERNIHQTNNRQLLLDKFS